MAQKQGKENLAVKERTRSRTKRPPLYKVLIHNDDFTPMEFVVMVLRQVFRLSPTAAEALMLAVHQQGMGVAGVFTRDIAETKATQVMDLARQYGHPLQTTVEEDQPQGEG